MASTLSLRRNERPEPAKPDEIIPELAPQWDPKGTYLGIGGRVGIAYMQGINYFNCRQAFVSEVPVKDRRSMPVNPKAGQIAGHRGIPRPVGSAPVVPQQIADAQRENAAALSAESHAE